MGSESAFCGNIDYQNNLSLVVREGYWFSRMGSNRKVVDIHRKKEEKLYCKEMVLECEFLDKGKVGGG